MSMTVEEWVGDDPVRKVDVLLDHLMSYDMDIGAKMEKYKDGTLAGARKGRLAAEHSSKEAERVRQEILEIVRGLAT